MKLSEAEIVALCDKCFIYVSKHFPGYIEFSSDDIYQEVCLFVVDYVQKRDKLNFINLAAKNHIEKLLKKHTVYTVVESKFDDIDEDEESLIISDDVLFNPVLMSDIGEMINDIMADALPPRSQKIMKMIYRLDEYSNFFTEADIIQSGNLKGSIKRARVGKEMSLSSMRIIQLEARALRLFRRPYRIYKLRDAL